jgi:hypothetical protein
MEVLKKPMMRDTTQCSIYEPVFGGTDGSKRLGQEQRWRDLHDLGDVRRL